MVFLCFIEANGNQVQNSLQLQYIKISFIDIAQSEQGQFIRRKKVRKKNNECFQL